MLRKDILNEDSICWGGLGLPATPLGSGGTENPRNVMLCLGMYVQSYTTRWNTEGIDENNCSLLLGDSNQPIAVTQKTKIFGNLQNPYDAS